MFSICINMGREDWPKYLSIQVQSQSCTLQQLQHMHPELFLSARVLYKRDPTNNSQWIKVQIDELLDSSTSYRSISMPDDVLSDSTICTACHKQVETPHLLRYHTGHLAAHEWGHGITFSWEWTCCNRIVSHGKVESMYAQDGCNTGLCSSCRDHTAYQEAIQRREQETEKAF